MKQIIAILLIPALLFFGGCGFVNQSTRTEKTTPYKNATNDVAYEIISKTATTWVDSIGTTWVQVFIEVENTGSENLYMKSCSYDLEDMDGNLISAQSNVSAYPRVIAPGEIGYICDATVLNTDSADIAVIPHERIERARVPLERYPISDVSVLDRSFGGVKIIGRVENNSRNDISLLYIIGVLYDDNNNPIGMCSTIMDEIKAGDIMGFEINSDPMPDNITANDVASYVVYAYQYHYQF